MILTIETNKRGFLKAIVALCKSAGILSYSLEDKPIVLADNALTSNRIEKERKEEKFYNTFGALANDDSWDNLVEHRHFTQKDLSF